MDDLLEQFLIEGRELVVQASDDLIALERSPADFARLDSLFRAIHTLKGSVALFDFAPMGAALHAAEDLLGKLRAERSEADRSAIDALLACIDASERWIEAIASTGRLPAGAEQEGRGLSQTLSNLMTPAAGDDAQSVGNEKISGLSGTPTEVSTRTMRVDTARIDALVDLVGELIVAKNNLGHLSAQVSAANSPFANEFAANVAGFERLTSDMNRAVLSLRMTPVSRVFERFPRWMRDTASKLGKSVEFEVRDGGVEADKSIVDGLFEPLLHILRNAVDHGIEDAKSRRSSGKPVAGRIVLEARAEGDQIIISVSDDGAGLDPSQLRNVAKRKGLLTEEAADALDDAAASDLIFMPGFSSSEAVTDISGRGVGMDAVRTGIATLGGRITVKSSVGAGTTVQMLLPQAVLSRTVIVAQAAGDWFGIPISGIVESARISRNRILPIRDGEAFVLRGRTLPFLRLADLLNLPEADGSSAEAKVLVISVGGELVGVEVEGFGERLDVFLRPLAGLLSVVPGVAGTALLGDGRVLLVLDLPALIG
jgi:two-component system chemotaxis sensor kinase CheA